MLIVLDKDRELLLFASIAEAERYLEAIDVQNLEYEFCDELGQRFVGEITSLITTFRQGAFALRPEGSADSAFPSGMLARAIHLGRPSGDVTSLSELKIHLERHTA